MDASPDLLVRDRCEEALDLVDPGCNGGRRVNMPAQVLGQLVHDPRDSSLVSRLTCFVFYRACAVAAISARKDGHNLTKPP